MADTILKLSEHKRQMLQNLDLIERELNTGRSIRPEEKIAFNLIKSTLSRVYLEDILSRARAAEQSGARGKDVGLGPHDAEKTVTIVISGSAESDERVRALVQRSIAEALNNHSQHRD